MRIKTKFGKSFQLARWRSLAWDASGSPYRRRLPRHLVFFALAVIDCALGRMPEIGAATGGASGPKTFASPNEASTAVYKAAKSGDGQGVDCDLRPRRDRSDRLRRSSAGQSRARQIRCTVRRNAPLGKTDKRRESPPDWRGELSFAVLVDEEFIRAMVFRHRFGKSRNPGATHRRQRAGDD